MGSRGHLTPAVFLDRDGTVNEEVGYLSRVEDIKLIPGSVEAIKRINREGWKTVVISNQSGVARGYFTEAQVRKVNAALLAILKNAGAVIDAIFYCPHHEDGNPPYNIECRCRKPAAGMVERAAQELNIDILRSVVIGDKMTDVLTAQNLKIPGILLKTGFGEQQLKRYGSSWTQPPQYVAENLLDAVEWWFRKIGKY